MKRESFVCVIVGEVYLDAFSGKPETRIIFQSVSSEIQTANVLKDMVFRSRCETYCSGIAVSYTEDGTPTYLMCVYGDGSERWSPEQSVKRDSLLDDLNKRYDEWRAAKSAKIV